MTDIETEKMEDSTAPSKWPLIVALTLGIIGASMGFFASYSGKVLNPSASPHTKLLPAEMSAVNEVAFLEIPSILVSLDPASSNKHLSFKSQLEVPLRFQTDVAHILPRVIDVINSYLRALETKDFESPEILMRLRSQLLRRIQVIAGKERVNNLLIMEFVLN